jgi:hypothetical protein
MMNECNTGTLQIPSVKIAALWTVVVWGKNGKGQVYDASATRVELMTQLLLPRMTFVFLPVSP